VSGCTFCAIVASRLPASLVHEDPVVLAFLDVHPRNPGHTLVVPVERHVSLSDLPEATAAQLFVVAHRIARALRGSSVRCEAVSLGLADGAAAGQEVSHVHLHVRPRFAGDARRAPRVPSRAELDELALDIRTRLQATASAD
jgi:diadenosine tetraphosphate (Ap4A) HIT family hydrolase